MRLITEDLIHEIRQRLNETKSLRGKVLLKNALAALAELREIEDKKLN